MNIKSRTLDIAQLALRVMSTRSPTAHDMLPADIKAQGAVGIADAATWHVQEIGDLNGDGKDDILFRNDAGDFYSWDMNGTHIQSEGAVPWADPHQHVVTQHWDLV
jgi:hypothetical protein